MKSRISLRKKEKKKKCANFSAFCKYFLIFKGGEIFFFTNVGIEYFDDYCLVHPIYLSFGFWYFGFLVA